MPNPRGIPLKNIHPENLDPRSNVRTSLRNTRRRHMALIHPVSNNSFSNRHHGKLRISHSPRRRNNSRNNLDNIHEPSYHSPIRIQRPIERNSYPAHINPFIYVSNRQFAANRLQSARTQKILNNQLKAVNTKYRLRQFPDSLLSKPGPSKPPRPFNDAVYNPLIQ
jgi:hypothetical protein